MLRSQYKTNNLVQYLCSDPGSGRDVNTCFSLPGCTKCPCCLFACQLLYRNRQAESQKTQNNMPRAELGSLQSHGKKAGEFTVKHCKTARYIRKTQNQRVLEFWLIPALRDLPNFSAAVEKRIRIYRVVNAVWIPVSVIQMGWASLSSGYLWFRNFGEKLQRRIW